MRSKHSRRVFKEFLPADIPEELPGTDSVILFVNTDDVLLSLPKKNQTNKKSKAWYKYINTSFLNLNFKYRKRTYHSSGVNSNNI